MSDFGFIIIACIMYLFLGLVFGFMFGYAMGAA